MTDILHLLQREYDLLLEKQKAVASLMRLYQKDSVLPIIADGIIPGLETNGELKQNSVALHPGYPYDSRWPQKILFVLEHENEPISTKQLARLLSTYEPYLLPAAINKAIANTYPVLAKKKKIALTEPGPNRKYYIPETVET